MSTATAPALRAAIEADADVIAAIHNLLVERPLGDAASTED